MKIKNKLFSVLACISLGFVVMKAQTGKSITPPDYPVPIFNKHILFYLQRSLNRNTIIYELNYNKDSTLNNTEPIKVYWIQYADHGQIQALSPMQKKICIRNFLNSN